MSRQNRRQRKKMRIGEYVELAFKIEAYAKGQISDKQSDSLLDAFVEEAIEGNGLLCVAGFNDHLWAFVFADGNRTSASPEQRLAVETWLKRRTELTNLDVSPLTDANRLK